jgi:DNA mismatch repair protein MutL
MSIKVLSDTLASQIAAGEVIERPVSVVKELIENAIDAQASSINLVVEGAGKRLIAVSDNGVGISPADLPLAVARHATSKISRSEDLNDIRTLGFRGEALASIGSVSRLQIQSKQASEVQGYCITVDGGDLSQPKACSTANGTIIRVQDLFYNLPARLKFLKADTTESRLINGLVTRYALAYPGIRWQLEQDGHDIFQTTGSGEEREILQLLYGNEDAKELLPLRYEEKDFSIRGYISSLQLTRSNRKDITLFVNGRWVQDSALTAAVIRAYNTMLMVGRYPVVALFLTIPTNQVDVNVHPSKAEVRFRDSDRLFSSLQRTIRRALLAYMPVPNLDTTALWGKQIAISGEDKRLEWSGVSGGSPQTVPPTAPKQVFEEGIQPGLSSLPLLRLVGQVAATYLIAEGPDGLYLIDQHAAHERVLFDKLLAQAQAAKISSQILVEPVTVDLSQEQCGLLEPQLPYLQELGFDVENFGPNSFVVRSIPVIFGNANPKEALEALVTAFEEDESPLENAVQARLAARICKRLAVKGGQILSDAEQRSLLADLEASPNPRTCPHGRPTMIHLSAALLERQFGRRGAI